jgi:hypothetical protein
MEPQRTEEDGKMEDVGEVGFKRPPVQCRFAKGRSGNPKGRPKGTKNLRTDLIEVLQERITVTEGGRKVRMPTQRALVKTLIGKSLRGDPRSITTLLNTIFRAFGFADASEDVEQPLDANEQELMTVLKARLQPKAEPSTKPEALLDDSEAQS